MRSTGKITEASATVWFKFTDPVILTEIGFSTRQKKKWLGQAPKKFDVVGSNDCKDWSILLSIDDAEFTRANEAKAWIIPCGMRGIYACYGIETFTTKGNKGNEGHVAIRNALMWGRTPL